MLTKSTFKIELSIISSFLYFNSRSIVTTSDDLIKIISNGRHYCPGCGSKFHLSSEPGILIRSAAPGWIDISRISSRLRWDPNASSGSPQIFVSQSLRQISSSKFDRQENWFSRQYTALEQARIKNRMSMKPGEAIALLQKLKNTNNLKVKSESNDAENLNEPLKVKQPLFEDIAVEETIVDGQFEELVKETNAICLKKDIVTEEKFKPLICQRCHDLRHDDKSLEDAQNLINGLTLCDRDVEFIRENMKSNSIICLVVDLIDLPHSMTSLLEGILEKLINPGEGLPSLYIVGNKVDLLPKHMRKIADYLEDLATSQFKRMKIVGISTISAENGEGVKELSKILLNLAKEHDSHIFLAGRTNVGKSQLFNILTGSRIATVNRRAGTTLGLIKRKAFELGRAMGAKDAPKVPHNLLLVDLPGIIDIKQSLLPVLKADEFKMMTIKDRLRVIRHSLKPGEVALLGGLIQLHCESQDPKLSVMLKFYIRPDIPYFRKKNSEIHQFLQENLGRTNSGSGPFLIPPIFNSIDDPRRDTFINCKSACSVEIIGCFPIEISFSDGLGWFSAHLEHPHQKANLTVYTPNGYGAIERIPLHSYIIRKSPSPPQAPTIDNK